MEAHQLQCCPVYLFALCRAHLLDLLVAVHDAEHVEQLALVLVDALDLHIHEGLGVEGDPCQLLHLLGSLLLGLQLHGLPFALELLVICLCLQTLQPRLGGSCDIDMRKPSKNVAAALCLCADGQGEVCPAEANPAAHDASVWP